MAAVVLTMAASGIALAQQPAAETDKPGIDLVRIRKNIFLLAGAGGNITISIGPDGVLLVDSGNKEASEQVLAAIRRINRDLNGPWQPVTEPGNGEGKEESVLTTPAPPKPIRFIINTSARPDHTGGNASLGKAGQTFTGGNVAGDLAGAGEGAAVLSFDKVLDQLSDEKLPFAGLPTITYFGAQMKLSHFFNGEGVQLLHIPSGVSDGDTIVHFRGSDVIATGDLITLNSYPVIDRKHGGSVQGLLAGLNRLLDMIVPEFRTEGGTLVVPGHGRLIDDADVAYYRDMVTIVRDRVQDMIKRDMTLAQIQASKPTADWDPIYGNDPSWTPDMFVESIYRSLMDNAQKK
jgi:glyoxylase-like metal-dependent hydrolase (beta-lactamase superfamily II)